MDNFGFPEGINVGAFMQEVAGARAEGRETPTARLEDLFSGSQHASLRESIKRDGVAMLNTDKEDKASWLGVDMDAEGNVFAIAAGVPRSPGRAQDFLSQVTDFTQTTNDRATDIGLFNRIYEAEGLVHNAVNKVTALVATEGNFKVRRVKGQRGKGGDKRAEEFRTLLQYWVENVNANATDAVVTGDRGLQAFIAQGVRQCLIEGDHVARTNWYKVSVPVLGGAKYSLPMNLQSFPGDTIQIPDALAGSGIELIYWVPPQTFIDALRGTNPDKNLQAYLAKLIPTDVKSALLKDGKYLLDSSLMMHVKHRGRQKDSYGTSFIKAAMTDIAYKRALQALDIVTIENLVNRLLFVMVGSDNPDSVYHKQEVTQRRVLMLQNMMRKIGPSSTIIWAGPDLEVKEAGAHGKILEMDGRYNMANSMIRASLGVPAALLTGEGADGKAAGWASIMGVSAQLVELQNQYKVALVTWAERIAQENGFQDVDVTWEFSQSLLVNKGDEIQMMLQAFMAGAISTQTFVEDGLGLNYEAEETRQLADVANKYKDQAFGPPLGAPTTNPAGLGGATGGRPTNTGQPDPRANQETQTPIENK